MKGIVRANMRFHGRRYVATGIAVAIATAFIVIAMSFGNAAGSAARNMVGEQYAGAAAVVAGKDGSVSEELWNQVYNPSQQEGAADQAQSQDQKDQPQSQAEAAPQDVPEGSNADLLALLDPMVKTIQQVPGVQAAAPVFTGYAGLVAGGTNYQGSISTPMPQPFVQPVFSQGGMPQSDTDIALDASTARALDVTIGGKIVVDKIDGSGHGPELTVTGIYGKDSGNSFVTMATSSALMTEQGLSQNAPYLAVQQILIAGDSLNPSEAQQQELASAVTNALSDQRFEVKTVDTALDEAFAQINTSTASMNTMMMIFPMIALIVAIIVITTTFQVIVQQRQRELALLRCLGASSKQVKRLIVGESFTVGWISSLIGVAGGAVLASWAVFALGLSASFAAGFGMIGAPTMVVVFILGTVITVIAGMRPAARVAKTSPLEALHPAAEVKAKLTGGWWARFVGGLVATVVFAALMVLGIKLGETRGFMVAMGAGFFCLISAIIFLSAVFPYIVTAFASPFRGMLTRMAAGNSRRNPGRTSSTGVAVIIGVTLVVMMITGAGSLRATMNANLDQKMPVDLVAVQSGDAGIPADKVEAIGSLDGVAKYVPLHGISKESQAAPTLQERPVTVIEADPLNTVVRSGLTAPAADEVMVSPDLGYDQGETLKLCVSGTCSDYKANLNSAVMDVDHVAVSEQTLAKLMPDAPVLEVAMQLSHTGDAQVIASDIGRIDSSLQLEGAAQLRALFDTIVNVMLSVVVALLGVSVLVALVGVSNTLSLSVAERTRENGLLRALGMTKRQVSRMLTQEALFISVTAAVIGTIMGFGFGVAGVYALPLGLNSVTIYASWWQILLVIAVAVIAAILASWVPGRKAARTSPVEALATE